jgi:hypothetical protein
VRYPWLQAFAFACICDSYRYSAAFAQKRMDANVFRIAIEVGLALTPWGSEIGYMPHNLDNTRIPAVISWCFDCSMT